MTAKQQIVLILMIFLLPLLGLLVFYNIYNVNSLNQRVAQTHENTILLYQNSLLRELGDTERAMSNFLANDPDCVRLRYMLPPLEAHVLGIQSLEKYRTMMSTKEEVGGYFLYSEKNNVFRRVYSRKYSYWEKTETEEFLLETIQETPEVIGRGWFFHQIGDRPFLFRFLGYGGTYSVCVVDLDYVEMPQDFPENPRGDFLFFVDESGKAVTEEERLAKAGLVPKLSPQAFTLNRSAEGNYLVVENQAKELGLTMMFAAFYQGFLMHMDRIQMTVLVASLVLVLLICCSLYFLTRFFLRPFHALVSTMERVRAGELHVKLEGMHSNDELDRLSNTFNAMLEEIRDLKIASYEQRLEGQQAQLQYLQIQIRPHFFLNCLKNLYALVQESKLAQVQEMILSLSQHLRFLFRDSGALVPLELELKNLENYMQLQKMVLPRCPRWEVEVDPGLEQLQVPPLSVLTFVENGMKYGVRPGQILSLHIRFSLLEDGQESYVSLRIRDNGPGFSPESLARLRGEGTGSPEAGEHIGIQNVCRRFRLIYGEKCTFLFENRGGAEVEVFFPKHPQPEQAPPSLPEGESKEGGRKCEP